MSVGIDILVATHPARQRVVACAAIQRVVAGATDQRVVAAVAFQRVVKRRTRQVLKIDERVAFGVAARTRPQRKADVHTRSERPHSSPYQCHPAIQRVRAAKARKDVGRTVADDDVVQRIAGAVDRSRPGQRQVLDIPDRLRARTGRSSPTTAPGRCHRHRSRPPRRRHCPRHRYRCRARPASCPRRPRRSACRCRRCRSERWPRRRRSEYR